MEEKFFNKTQRNNELIPVRHSGWNLVTMTWVELESVLIYTLVPSMTFSLLGVLTNLLNIVVLSKMGLHKTTTACPGSVRSNLQHYNCMGGPLLHHDV
ncbi:hypothetical protein RRG08_036331 [Elysia crispata]|uniref:Uncharacterized protein n=1 Tax=Elysia crispata TaxID=231223 RepID=A0AAE0ZPN5_9GAST|nr:hypothetical protein RRG08_036331 [Elysia crispata]